MATPEISVERREHGGSGEYVARLPGSDAAARLTWTLRGDVRHAEHTFVPPAVRGGGIAAKLVEALVKDAREGGFRVAPDCSYVAAAFRRHPEWADLRA